jgi:hypothetical protein
MEAAVWPTSCHPGELVGQRTRGIGGRFTGRGAAGRVSEVGGIMTASGGILCSLVDMPVPAWMYVRCLGVSSQDVGEKE